MTLFQALGPFAASGSGMGDLEFITSTTFSAASTVSVDNCFSSRYTHYLMLRDVSGTVAQNIIQARMRVGGVDASAANYRQQSLTGSSTTVSGARATGNTAFNPLLGYVEATSIGLVQAWMSNPFQAVPTTAVVRHTQAATGNIVAEYLLLAHDLSTSYDGISFLVAQGGGASTGTITGTIYIYGLVA